jgi:ferredoxin-NADP reductase
MKQWLDRVTGAVTMYLLVIVSLSAILVVALVLSFFGQFRSGPLDLIVSVAIGLAVAVGTGLLAARMMRVPVHLESSIITGLLIVMILPPTLEPLKLFGIALAAVIATASKYLLAVRGRHIFNPAAMGVFIVTLAGLGLQSWWVGTPYLQIPTLIGAFLVLYRTQHLRMGVLFVGLAIAIRVGFALVNGATIDEALSFTLLSSPILFLAGFMLSEPLTLPPRRWQQLSVAALVAVLFALPSNLLPNVGPVFMTPALALLIGNLVAFFFGQRRGIRMEYLGKRQLSDDTWELSFQPKRPVRYFPGQYMELTIPHQRADLRGKRRYFSIASAPNPDGPITFALTVPAKSSSFKNALLALEPGTTVHGTLVGGDFKLPGNPAEPLLLVAGGIGITPFASQLEHATATGDQRDVVVLYSSSTSGALPYTDLLAKSGARVVVYGPGAPSPLPANFEYGGTGRITPERVVEKVPDVAKRHTYISGPPGLVNDLRRALRQGGAKHVHSDYFSGY